MRASVAIEPFIHLRRGPMQSFAIIPAAGRSQRMGQPKLLLPWGERTIIEHVLGVWRASRVTQVVLIVHPQDARLAELGRGCGAVVVQPADAPREMKVSVQIGLAHVARASRRARATPGCWRRPTCQP